MKEKKRVLIVLITFVMSITFLVKPADVTIYAQGGTATPAALGTVIKDHLGFEMVYVPSDTFQMGITVENFTKLYPTLFNVKPDASDIRIEGETGIFDTYTTTLSSFWIDRYEVTIEQYSKYMNDCMNAGSCRRIDLSYAPQLIDDPHKPQVGVPWYDALQFCSIRDARLPSEEEWEYAAGGTSGLFFPWGNTMVSSNVTLGNTYPVGTKPGNISWAGVYDMAGNAAEWTDDRYKPYVPASLYWPRDAEYEVERVIRGGSWESNYFQLTTFARDHGSPTESDSHVGFRCARTAKPK